MDDNIRGVILETLEASLEAQLAAVRKLRKAKVPEAPLRMKGKSQTSMVFDVLEAAGTPLHLREILTRVEATFGVKLDADSLVSALTKCVLKGDRFIRPEKNTFALRGTDDAR